MGFFDSAIDSATAKALRLAEQIERSAGPHAALPMFRPLLVVRDADIRCRATLGLLRCLVRIGDPSEVIAESVRLRELRGAALLDEVIELCKALLAQGHALAAAKLAEAEAIREPTARALYLHARCLERSGDPSCMEVYARAAERADVEPGEPGAAEIGVASRVRRIERLASSPAALPQIIAEAAAADPLQATPAQRLVIAAGRLASPSRFTRAAGLSILEDIAKRARPELADAAVRMAAQHADTYVDGLTAVEADRLGAVLRHWREPKEREAALARLRALLRIAAARGEEQDLALTAAAEAAPEIFPLICRARAVLAGGGHGSYALPAEATGATLPTGAATLAGASPDLRLASLGLDLVVALRRKRPSEAISALTLALTTQRSWGRSAPASLWTGVYLALLSPEGAVREAAIELAEALLSAGTALPPPPIRMGSFAAALRHARRADLAARVLRGAAVAKEPGAAEELSLDLLRHGWTLAEQGEREAAIAALREARSLSARAPQGGTGAPLSPPLSPSPPGGGSASAPPTAGSSKA